MVRPFSKKKKVPKVPFPEGHLVSEDALKFPSTSDRVIKPENVKKAAGLEKEPKVEKKTVTAEKPSKKKPQKVVPPTEPAAYQDPLYIKMDVYQRIIGELDSLKQNLGDLGHANRSISHSEYNEESNFNKLRKTMKSLHDRLLQVDKILFKS